MDFRLQKLTLKVVASLAGICVAAGAIYAIAIWTKRWANVSNDDAATIEPPAVVASASQFDERRSKPNAAGNTLSNAHSAQIPRVLESFPQDVVVNYAALAKAARNGDVDAAKRIYGMLIRCKNVPESRVGIDGLIEHEKLHPSSDTSVFDSASFLDKQWRNCSQLSQEQRASTAYWLLLAARSGDSEAKLDYVLSAQPTSDLQDPGYWKNLDEYRTTARAYLEEEISAGSVRALSIAATNYAEGGIYDFDLSKRYAYLYAFVLASGETEGAEMHILNKLRKELGPTQTQGASIEGEDIVKRCCIH